MHCPCCNSFDYNNDFIHRAQALRWIVQKPFVLDKRGGGFYRCRDYQMKNNPKHPDSMHLLGRAMDVSSIGWSAYDKALFVKNALNLGLSIGAYETFFHIDFRIGKQVWFRA